MSEIKQPEVTLVDIPRPLFKPRKRVAAYARVSSGKDAMLHSLSAQVEYYNDTISGNPEWEYVGVYADEAMTGTKDERPELQRMLADCRAGRIDLILVKSLSRLSRNTVTTLEIVRELKNMSIEIRFEKENLSNMNKDGDLFISVLASYAQEESLSVSENCKWRIRDRFQQGISCWFKGLGYRIKNDVIEIVPDEAELVKRIFTLYVGEDGHPGLGKNAIMKLLNDEDAAKKTRSGAPWSENTIDYILRNEKYTGDLLLQKFFTVDHISKKKRRNRGEFPQYFVEGDHPAIIDRETFDKAQAILRERAARFHASTEAPTLYPFSFMIVCDNCGKCYKRKITHGKIAWNCASFLRFGKSVCHTKQIPEDTLYELTNDVLGLETFDEAEFKRRIRKIRIPTFNHVVFVFKDGHEEERVWKDRSRSESWDDAARERARQNTLKRYHGGNAAMNRYGEAASQDDDNNTSVSNGEAIT